MRSDCLESNSFSPRTYALKGSATTLVIERLRLRILGVPLPSIDVREGRGVRGLIERVRGRRKDGSKRPNVYSWCYADDDDVWRGVLKQVHGRCGFVVVADG